MSWDRVSSSGNFLSDGTTQDILFPSRAADFVQNRFSLLAEYGIAPEWSIYGKGAFLSADLSSISTGALVADGSGLENFHAGIKWRVVSGNARLALETFLKIPAHSNSSSDVGDLVVGDGNFDLAMRVHGAYTYAPLTLFLTPGVIWRFGGYASQFSLEGGLSGYLGPINASFFAHLLQPLSEQLLFDSGLDRHDAVGAGGSYMRLAGSPQTIAIGGKLGLHVVRNFGLEMVLSSTVGGSRAPEFTQFGFNFWGDFDFHKEVKKKRLREVPLDGDASDPF